MDSRALILAGAFALFVIALAYLVFVLVSTAHRAAQERQTASRQLHTYVPPGPVAGGPAEGEPAARTGGWQPPPPEQEPAMRLTPVSEIMESLEREDRQSSLAVRNATGTSAPGSVTRPTPAQPPAEAPSAPAQAPDPVAAESSTPVPTPVLPEPAAPAPPAAAPPRAAADDAAGPAPTVEAESPPPVAPPEAEAPADASDVASERSWPWDDATARAPQRPGANGEPVTAEGSEAPSDPRLDPAEQGPEPEYRLVAPVEMWFEDVRVGVRSGSHAHGEFVRLADELLGDARRPR